MMTGMDLSGEPGGRVSGGRNAARVRAEVLFQVLADEGFGWHRIGQPHADASAACRTAALYVHLLRPELQLGELQDLAATAVPALEEGAVTVAVIDGKHRIDRIELIPRAADPVWGADRS